MSQPQIQNKRERGRPRGSKGTLFRTITDRVGEWSWNHDRLTSKIVQQEGCWAWTGTRHPKTGNLFGAFKNDVRQMTQVNRLIAMHELGQPIVEYGIYMSCQNKWCCNFSHYEFRPNRKQHQRGPDRITYVPEPRPKEPREAKPKAKVKPLKGIPKPAGRPKGWRGDPVELEESHV